MSKVLIKYQKVTKSEQWLKYHIFWSKDKMLQNLNNDQNVENSYLRSKSYKSEQWPNYQLFWSKVKKKSEKWPKCHKYWSEDKKLQDLNNDQNVASSD